MCACSCLCVCVCVCVSVKRLYSSLWSPKVSPAAAHGERLHCVLPPSPADTMGLCVADLRNAERWQNCGEEKGRGGFGKEGGGEGEKSRSIVYGEWIGNKERNNSKAENYDLMMLDAFGQPLCLSTFFSFSFHLYTIIWVFFRLFLGV